MSRRRRSREVEIFNFSFLDILACTIGLLIFIMVMVFVLQSGSAVADTSQIVSNRTKEAERVETQSIQDQQITSDLEIQYNAMKPSAQITDLLARREQAVFAEAAARSADDTAEKRAVSSEARLQAARLARDAENSAAQRVAVEELSAATERHASAAERLAHANEQSAGQSVVLLPHQRPGDNSPREINVLHVDCGLGQVVLLRAQPDHKLVCVGTTANVHLADPESAFQREVTKQRTVSNGSVLFWVRPDGNQTLQACESSLPEGVTFGFEPADAAWTFQSTP